MRVSGLMYRSDDEQHVRAATRGGGFRRARAAERPDVEGMRTGHDVVAAVRGDHRQRRLVREPHEELVRLGPVHAAPHEQERPFRAVHQARGLTDRVGVRQERMRRAIPIRRELGRFHGLVVEHVARDLDEDRTAPSRHRGAERRSQVLDDPLRPRHLDAQLRHRLEDVDQVELLERVLAVVIERDAADDGDHRRMRDVRGRDAGQEIRRARAAGDETRARQSRDAREAVRHERGALLVPDVHVFHALVVVERVEHVEKRAADDPEDVSDLLGPEHIDHRASRVPPAHVGILLRGARPATFSRCSPARRGTRR